MPLLNIWKGTIVINLFIDANIWLDLFHFSSNDLEEFGKLNDTLGKDTRLFMTEQVVCEIQRNRDAKISDAYKRFKELRFQIPNLCKGYPEYDAFAGIADELSKVHRELCHKIETDFGSKSLPADKLINRVYANANKLKEDPEIIRSAELRYKRGNPPGKNNSLGDAINWESLLANVPDKEDLFFISADKDYQSPMDSNRMNLFLVNEWSKRKGSAVIYYSSLVAFTREHQKDINLKSETEKEQLIEALLNSGSFAQTHGVIAQLSKYEHLSEKQMNQVLRAVQSNHQVGAILDDKDVTDFFVSIVRGRVDKIESPEEARWVLMKIGLVAEFAQDSTETT
jgi:hypothetical protein